MKFDTIIIGGGLAGLACGIQLAEQGKKCAIVTSGQSAIHFFSGSFDLLGNLDGKEITNPLKAMSELPAVHPYKRVGKENVVRITGGIQPLLNRASLSFLGQPDLNHFVLTPMGTMKPTWLTLNDFTRFEEKDNLPYKNARILNFTGFLDFHTLFIKDGLAKIGVNADIQEIAMKQFEAIRCNPSEMRSSNIAKVFDQGTMIDEFTLKVNELSSGAEVVILPAVFGLFNNSVTVDLKKKIKKPLLLLPAIPPSTPGIRSQITLCKRFQELGGTYFLGDIVQKGTFEGNRLASVETKNHGDITLQAENFVLATGSFYSKGLVARPDGIHEPIFGLDVDANNDRRVWFDEDVFNKQPFMHYGVKTDESFHAIKNGTPIENLYVTGSVLGGANPLKEGSGAGIALVTSLHTAEQILR